jgi:hypothetical protein
MKRDWHLLGRIFTEIENERFTAYLEASSDEEQDKIIRHLGLLIDAGYIVGGSVIYGNYGDVNYREDNSGFRITLEGYDFAERVQDRTLLNRTIAMIKKAGLMVSMETLKQFTPLAVAAIAQAVSGG